MPATLLCAGLPTQNSPCEHRPAPMPAQPCPPRPPRPGPGLGHLRGRGRAPLGQPTGTHLPPEPVGGGRRPCPADRGTTCQRFQRPARPGPGGHAGAGRCGGGGSPGPADHLRCPTAGGRCRPLGADRTPLLTLPSRTGGASLAQGSPRRLSTAPRTGAGARGSRRLPSLACHVITPDRPGSSGWSSGPWPSPSRSLTATWPWPAWPGWPRTIRPPWTRPAMSASAIWRSILGSGAGPSAC